MKVRYTVPSDQSRVGYLTNGSTQLFAVPFVFFDDTDLQVILVDNTTAVETPLVLTTDFTVAGGGGSTGSVTAVAAYATGSTLVIQREIPYTQEIDYSPNDGFPAEVNEEGLDRNTMQVQQVRRRARQTPKLPATYDPESGDITFPLPVAGKTLVANAGATGWDNADIPTAGSTLPTALVGLANRDLLEYDSGSALWRNQTLIAVLGRLLTTQGDIIRRGVSGVERLAIGAANRLLKSNGTTESWAQADLTTDVTGVLPRANGGFTPANLSAALGSDIAMSNTALYYDGPSIAQGTSGLWYVSGSITLGVTAGNPVLVKLWDGTTVVASGEATGPTVTGVFQVHLSGIINNPAANLRISARSTGIAATMYYNVSGNSKDSNITAFRIG